MALNKAQLITDLTAIFSNVDSAATPTQKAQQIADAIDSFVKSGSVTSNGQTGPCAVGVPATISNLPGTIS
jgi:hypothetical protein